MNENHRSIFWQSNIRLSGKVFSVKSKPVAERVKKRPHPHFWPCVSTLDRSHISAALFRRVNVGHDSGGPCSFSVSHQRREAGKVEQRFLLDSSERIVKSSRNDEL